MSVLQCASQTPNSYDERQFLVAFKLLTCSDLYEALYE